MLGKVENLFPESQYYEIKIYSFQQQQQQNRNIKTGKYDPFETIKNT